MKMSKRIFVVLLTVAFLVCAFAFTASADAEEVTIANYDYLLDYYEKPVIFALDFSNDNVDYLGSLFSNYISDTSKLTYSVVEDATAPGGKYFNADISSNRPVGATHFYFNWNSVDAVSDFYFDATVSGTNIGKSGPGGLYAPKYRLTVSDTAFTDFSLAASAGQSLLVLDFNSGEVYYTTEVKVNDNVEIHEVKAEYTLTADAWYNISLTYVAGDSCTLTITNYADSEDTITISDVYLPYETIQNVRFGVRASDVRQSNGNRIKVASINAAGGTVRRDLYDTQAAIESGILDLYELYCSEDISIADKIGLCDVTNKLTNDYGFTTDNAEVISAIEALKLGSITLYSDKLASCLDELSTLENYYEKRALVDEYLGYADILSNTDLSPVGDEAATVIEANIASIYGVDQQLVRAASDSANFVGALNGVEEVVTSRDYTILISYYDAASIYGNIDMTYEGVSEAYAYFTAIENKVIDIKYEGDCFIADVQRANDDTLTFVERYNAYCNVGDVLLLNTTYPGVLEAIDLYNNSVVPYMSGIVELADTFIMYVAKADYSTYLSAKQENLDIAAEYMNICEPTYPGVAEAKLLYAEITEYVKNNIAAAKAYIDAVNAMDGLTGDDLLAAIDNAKQLQAAGNVLGVDGVIEANIKLNQTISTLELADKYCTYFISLVNALDKTTDTQALYELICDAKAAEADAATSYAGVTEASAKLAKAIDDFNAKINKVNSIYETATNAAANTAGVGKTANTVADYVIAIVKKFFDDEE